MSKPGREPLLFLALIVLFISFPKKIDALRVRTTLYEDLTSSSLVVAGRILHKKTADSLTYHDLEVGNVIYGRSDSPTLSIVTVGRTGKLNDKTLVIFPGAPRYGVGEEVLAFLRKTASGAWGQFRLSKGVHYVTVRKIHIGGLEKREVYFAELKRLAQTIEMGDVKRRESVFLDLLSSKNDLIVESSVKELGNMKSQKGLAKLVRLVHVGNREVRFQVIDALRQIGGKVAVAAISSALEDESPRIRARATNSLGRMGAREAEDKLIQIFLTEDEYENVKINAVVALGNIGSPKTIRVFVDALNKAKISKALRRSVESALRRLRQS